jgi:hypothetical protein
VNTGVSSRRIPPGRVAPRPNVPSRRGSTVRATSAVANPRGPRAQITDARRRW